MRFLLVLLVLTSTPLVKGYSIVGSVRIRQAFQGRLTAEKSREILTQTGFRRKQRPNINALFSIPKPADPERRSSDKLATTYAVTGILSAVAWITIAYVALSFHPDPKFADCTLRHNLLTMGQAFAFPLPIGWASFQALYESAKAKTLDSETGVCLNLGLSVASLWLAGSAMFPKVFAFGYDLYSTPHKIAAAVIHGSTGICCLNMALKTTTLAQAARGAFNAIVEQTKSTHKNGSYYGAGMLGLLYFALRPIDAPYPLATVPTILGKRLSRPASAFTFLGSIVAYCLKEMTPDDASKHKIRETLRKGLAWGTSAHLLLIFLKLIGVDGGGLILPGRGLWEVYPAMMAVPHAMGASLVVYAVLCYAAWTDKR